MLLERTMKCYEIDFKDNSEFLFRVFAPTYNLKSFRFTAFFLCFCIQVSDRQCHTCQKRHFFNECFKVHLGTVFVSRYARLE